MERWLFPVVEIPRHVFSAQSRFETEEEIVEISGSTSPLPFLLRGTTIYTLSPLSPNSGLAAALTGGRAACQEQFAAWLSDAERSQWAIELLNRFLRLHAWKRGLRFDEYDALFYFTRSKPKKLWWEFERKIALREVTAPRMKRYELEDRREVEYQCGWKHEAVQAGFALCGSGLAVGFEPTWFWTQLDGKTPATRQPLAPLRSSRSGQDSLRAIRFWSAVFAKDHRELRIETGAGPIRVKLTPPLCSAPRIVSKEDTVLDYIALTSMEVDGTIPEFAPMEF